MSSLDRWMLEDFAAGQVFETQRRTITESDVVVFAGWSWDTNPVHTDAVGQEESRYGARIAHGVLGVAVAMGLASRLGVFEGCSIALLGITEWQFLAPVFIGDTVRVRVEILGVRRTSGGLSGVLDREFTLLNQDAQVMQRGRIGLLVSARSEPPTPAETGRPVSS